MAEVRVAGTSFKVHDEDAPLYGHDVSLIDRVWLPLPGQVCVDVGFGPGTWTLAALARDAWTFSFDPRIEAVDLLTRQVLLNAFGRAIIVPSAVLEKETKRRFSDSSFHWGTMARDVAAVSLDGFFRAAAPPSIDYINVDAEGAEVEVLRGAMATLRKYKPKIVIEVHKNVSAGILAGVLGETECGYACLFRDGFLLAEVPRRG